MMSCGKICIAYQWINTNELVPVNAADHERKPGMYFIDPPKEVMHIIDVLMQHGYEAYAVGGCIRDSVMGRQPKDWDITTSAYPDVVKGLLKRLWIPVCAMAL
jgi:hypothetical protein